MTALGATAPGVASAPHVGKGREAGFHGFDKGNDPSIDLNGHGHPGFAPGGFAPAATLPADLITKLEAKGVTADQITTFENDQKRFQTAIDSVDPTLQAKIKTEEQASTRTCPLPRPGPPAPPSTSNT